MVELASYIVIEWQNRCIHLYISHANLLAVTTLTHIIISIITNYIQHLLPICVQLSIYSVETDYCDFRKWTHSASSWTTTFNNSLPASAKRGCRFSIRDRRVPWGHHGRMNNGRDQCLLADVSHGLATNDSVAWSDATMAGCRCLWMRGNTHWNIICYIKNGMPS